MSEGAPRDERARDYGARDRGRVSRSDRGIAIALGLGIGGVLFAFGLAGGPGWGQAEAAATGNDAMAAEPNLRVEPIRADMAADMGLDFEFYRQAVEPIFLRGRGGFVGSDAACVSCHAGPATTPLKLQPPQETGGELHWTLEQSRRNFGTVARLVDPVVVENSRLLRAPLAPVAGGRRHGGGVHWSSTDHPEYQVIARWIEAASPEDFVAPQPTEVDFEFFRHCVQPIFVNPHENAIGCVECHGGAFAPSIPADRDYWTEEQSRTAYEELMYLIEPGHPQLSRFLHKPLHPNAGGDLMHNGGRRWLSIDDPERQALASWIRGDSRGSSCPPALQFDEPSLQ